MMQNKQLKNMHAKKHNKGFTLLELLVAVTIFSFISVMAYGALFNMISGNKAIEKQEQTLKLLQRTMMFLERDIRQIVSRPRRISYIDTEKAFDYGFDADGLMEFTRSGNANPTGAVQSSLQRVRYDLEENVLIRKTWKLVDHIDQEPSSAKLLGDIESFELRLLDDKNEWLPNWTQSIKVPKAIEINIEHKFWGKIRRLIPVK